MGVIHPSPPGSHRIGDMYIPLFKEYYTCLVPVSKCTVFFQAFSISFCFRWRIRGRENHMTWKKKWGPDWPGEELNIVTKSDGNIFLFAYANVR